MLQLPSLIMEGKKRMIFLKVVFKVNVSKGNNSNSLFKTLHEYSRVISPEKVRIYLFLLQCIEFIDFLKN